MEKLSMVTPYWLAAFGSAPASKPAVGNQAYAQGDTCIVDGTVPCSNSSSRHSGWRQAAKPVPRGIDAPANMASVVVLLCLDIHHIALYTG
jgi:hypothetical protein